MTTALSASRNKFLNISNHNDTNPARAGIHPSDSPKLSSRFSFRCLDHIQPSSGEDDPSDMSADESDEQDPAGNTTVPPLRGRMTDEVDPDVGSEFNKGPPRPSSWADSDLSIIIAVIVPLANWLTGTDQIKNLFLVLFLIVYLHQLVQVPWELYHAARQRRSHPSLSSLNPPGCEDEAAIKVQKRLATAELQRHELAYLFISMITPFAGAALLRSVLGIVNGIHSISWFSTTLFVLAAGVRPWGHLISRLRERTTHLHDAVHYPSPDAQLIVASRLQAMADRMNSLEQELEAIKRVMTTQVFVEEMHGDISSALQDTERAVRKQERKNETIRISFDTRLATLEKAVSRAERARVERVRGIAPGNSAMSSATDDRAYSRHESAHGSIFCFLRTIANGFTFNYFDLSSPPASPSVPQIPTGGRPPLHHTITPSRLETIEEDETEPLTAVRLDKNFGYPDNAIPHMSRQNDSDTANGRLRQPRRLAVAVAHLVGLPYRLAVGILVALSPPLGHLFN
ncbi:hypothetical protein F5148DRAFT_678355 [Russula earlei]|uniref:Uncharacterized protein n=1 Tax=Russula earlei TaxID=71964 RepID=A0ACC0UEB7_9AGAM|nr:hypothetical protein F5148DRAFT_678355 [Russula earlei]